MKAVWWHQQSMVKSICRISMSKCEQCGHWSHGMPTMAIAEYMLNHSRCSRYITRLFQQQIKHSKFHIWPEVWTAVGHFRLWLSQMARIKHRSLNFNSTSSRVELTWFELIVILSSQVDHWHGRLDLLILTFLQFQFLTTANFHLFTSW